MEELLVSIIVPVYNVEVYIAKCIESIQRQTYKNLQIILVDDGSTDKSGEICDNYALFDQRIQVIHQKNKGPVGARKIGLENAKGKYIGFVDGDDYIDSCMYYNLMNEIITTKSDFVHFGYWDNNSKKILPQKMLVELELNRKQLLGNAIYGRGITPSLWSKLFDADLIKKSHSLVPEKCFLGEDLICLCICILESRRVAFKDEAFYHYRVRKESLSHKNNIYDLSRIIHLYENLCDIFQFYNYYESMKSIMDEFLWNNSLEYIDRINQYDFQIARYFFNDGRKLEGKQIVIYGAGKVGRDYYAQISRYTDCVIEAWIDKYPEKYQYPHINIYGLEILKSIKFDILIIAVMKEKIANEIYNELEKIGVNKSKIYWSKPERYGLTPV